MPFPVVLLLLAASVLDGAATVAYAAQFPLATQPEQPAYNDPAVAAVPPTPGVVRQLRGRFLHITDIHPDPHMKYNASVSSSCHRMNSGKKGPRAGYWGTPYSDCDSPLTLVDLTLDYLAKNWANKIDWVIWTGDSARHDNDNKLPRTPAEIFDLNRMVTARMQRAFKGIPIVPCIGNNDIWPHNIMQKGIYSLSSRLSPTRLGPNTITNEFSAIWRPMIPFASYQVFQRGGYFSVELVPGKVAAISLNTLYWYDSNKAVSGCEYGDDEDPGNLEFDWLEVQLMRYRDRGVQVWLTGHVPPSPGNYYPECYYRYGEVALHFQDTILGHLFGHMNVDHFFWIDPDDLSLPDKKNFTGVSLDDELLEDFKQLPKKSKMNLDDYAIINVSPSVIPTYLPSFRIFSYNVTGEGSPDANDGLIPSEAEDEYGEEVDEPTDPEPDGGKKKKKKHGKKRRHGHRHHPRPDCSKPENANRRECRPRPPRHTDENSPSRTNRLWSPIGYAQYHLPDIGTANLSYPPTFKLEYVTFQPQALHPPPPENDTDTPSAATDDFVYPIPLKMLPRPLRNATSTHSKYAPYRMKDLTIGEWVGLARRLAAKENLWTKFQTFMFQRPPEDD